MEIFSCFKVLLPPKFRQNRIQPESPKIEDDICMKYPWKLRISTSYPKIFWETNFIAKPGGLIFGVGLKVEAFDVCALPTLPPKRLPPINREDIASLRQPKRVKRKGKSKQKKLSVDEKLAKAKARREAAEIERREKTLKRLRIVVPE